MSLKRSRKKAFDPLFTPLAGAHRHILKSLTEKYDVDPHKSRKLKNTLMANWIGSPFRRMDALLSNEQVANFTIDSDPIFIIGHWRSGTTLLHNILTKIPSASYPTTFQGVFPSNLFFVQFLFKMVMKGLMPNERPADHVKIDPNYPQEEEIALGNEIEHSFYYWFYFPRETKAFMDKYMLDENPEILENWKNNYLRFVKRAVLNTGGGRFISKNPPNTFRVKPLLELFPNAKFIFLHRNPYQVFMSSKRFFWETINGLTLQEIGEGEFDKFTILIYKEMMDRYLRDRAMIPQNQLVELSYTDLLKDPMEIINRLNEQWNLNLDAGSISDMQAMLKSTKSHQVKKYDFPDQYINMINENWGTYIDYFDYERINPRSAS